MQHEHVINFLKTIEAFKTCERTCRTTQTDRAESDAEHSWHLALFLMTLEHDLGNVDFSKLLKMTLIHDLPELYAGDTNPYRDSTENKEENEKVAAEKLFSMLPASLNAEFSALFQEYMEQKTAESQLVKSADKLMPLIQNVCTNDSHSSYRNMKVTYSEARAYMDPFFRSGSLLHNLYTKLIEEAREKGVFYDSPE